MASGASDQCPRKRAGQCGELPGYHPDIGWWTPHSAVRLTGKTPVRLALQANVPPSGARKALDDQDVLGLLKQRTVGTTVYFLPEQSARVHGLAADMGGRYA